MTFDRRYMTLASFGGGPGNFKLYHLLTADAAAAVDTAGYFDDFAGQLDIGDLIFAVTVDDVDAPTSVSGVSLHVVNAAGQTMDVSNSLLAAIGDTD